MRGTVSRGKIGIKASVRAARVMLILLILATVTLVALGKYTHFAKCSVLIGGHISSDTIWMANNVYQISNDTHVDSGVTLEIRPGAEVIFATGVSLIVEGSFYAIGTASDPIVFTSDKIEHESHDVFPGAWKTISFLGNENEHFILKYAIIEYAVDGVTIQSIGSSVIENCVLTKCSDSGIRIKEHTHLSIRANRITLNKYGISAVNFPDYSGIEIVNNSIYQNENNGIRIVSAGSTYGSNHLHDITVLSNKISFNGKTGIYLATGWSATGGELYNIIISNNTIFTNHGNGIHLMSSAQTRPGRAYFRIIERI